jgi:DNA repair exonuclease SbcCD ATPase subunit
VAAERKREPEASGGSVQSVLADAFRSQVRTLERSQDWVDSTLTTLRDQAESYTGLLRSVQSSLAAMERAVSSQAETTRALQESLDAARTVISSAANAQERSLAQAESFFSGMLQTLTAQLQVLRAQAQVGTNLLGGAVGVQDEAFLTMTQEWMNAYARLLDSALGLLPGGRSGPSTSG